MKQYIVDAFTNEIFSGNPAAICILDQWPADELMMKITRENNLSETAFAVGGDGSYHLRWFTPGGEIDLCGHATLAATYVITRFYEPDCTLVNFKTLSGNLAVVKRGDLFELDFPAYELKPVEITEEMIKTIGAKPREAYIGRDLLCVFDSEETIRNLTPDMNGLLKLDGLLLQVTAIGKTTDCVSRSFAPKLNVNEDPVCGSGHCHIAPYWINKTGKAEIIAYQASSRGGTLHCRLEGNRVKMSGNATLFAISELQVSI
ncbi:MAG: PhzF family phenazine biosynthesis protein [Clostridia bacterium]|nr:PhzF family phenazine biosynthesis protein [Lachnospiraceae bacterium]NCC01156.1 PhzF family phenazine biosynthesis protein [Clostridia bacterium]NCD03054.1 PhzF family phenazine biosynthesis protein [Clostridia bacterium]